MPFVVLGRGKQTGLSTLHQALAVAARRAKTGAGGVDVEIYGPISGRSEALLGYCRRWDKRGARRPIAKCSLTEAGRVTLARARAKRR